MFLIAYTDLRRPGRRSVGACTARSLRRVGAEIAVVVHCSPASAKRLRRDARYENLATDLLRTGDGEIEVAVLSDLPVDVRTSPDEAMVLCDLRADGRATAVATIGEPVQELYRVLLRLDENQPVIVVGSMSENLDDPATIDVVGAAGFIDTHPPRPADGDGRPVRAHGILVRGLRSYGDGQYADPDGCVVQWARLGH